MEQTICQQDSGLADQGGEAILLWKEAAVKGRNEGRVKGEKRREAKRKERKIAGGESMKGKRRAEHVVGKENDKRLFLS